MDEETADQMERNIELAREINRDVAEDPEGFPEEFVVVPLDDEGVSQLLTGERARILRTLRDQGPFRSIADLAEALDRDPTRVGRDLDLLENFGLVDLEEHGRSKRVRRSGRAILVV